MKSINIKLNLFVLPLILKSVVFPLIIFTATLLFFCAGVGNLLAQERQQGWFVGASPYSFIGAKIKKSTSTAVVVTGAATFDYQATINNDPNVSKFDNGSLGNTNAAITDEEAKQSLIRGAIELCKQGTATGDRFLDVNIPLDANDSASNPDYPTTDTVDYYIGYRGGLRTNVDRTTEICHLPASDALPSIIAAAATESSESLQGGLALQFGYNLEKYRVSLTNFSSKGGGATLTNNLVLADWFLAQGFYAGVGITNAKLETEIGSQTKTAAAFNLGYSRKIGNLQLEAGYLVLNSSFALQKETERQTVARGTSETQTLGETEKSRNRIAGFRFSAVSGSQYDSIVEVTRTTTASTATATETTKIELQPQKIIYFRLIWKFH